MRKIHLFASVGVLFLFAAVPVLKQVNTLDDVDYNYRQRTTAAKAAYDDALAKADTERLAGLKLLLARATKAGDSDRAAEIQKKIDEVTSAAVTGKAKSVVYLCQKSGSMLSVFSALKQQLKESVDKLEPATEFNIVFFDDAGAEPLFKDRMQTSSPENKKLAASFVDHQVAGGGSLPVPAILFSLREKPDTVYFLSDGLPMMAKPSDLEKAFKEGNPDRKIHINCIELESDPSPELEQRLRQISQEGNGTLTKIRKSDM